MIVRNLRELIRSPASAAVRLIGFAVLCLLMGRAGDRGDIPVFRASMLMPCALLLASLSLSLRGVRLLRRDLRTGFWERFTPLRHVDLRVFLALKAALLLMFTACFPVFLFVRLCLGLWEGEGELIRAALALLPCGTLISLGLLTGVTGRKERSVLIHFLMLNAAIWLSTWLIDETLWGEAMMRVLNCLPFANMVYLVRQTRWDGAALFSVAVLGAYDFAFALGAYLRFRQDFFRD